jgi:hypothetical protein
MAVIETTRFRLRSGVDRAEFLEADFRLQTEFIPHHPGFMRRTLAHDDAGNWIAVALWMSASDAEVSASRWPGDAVASAFLDLVDPASVDSVLYSTLD